MRKVRFLKRLLLGLGLLVFLTTGVRASEPEMQVAPDSGSNLSSAPDTLTQITRGTERKRRKRIRKPDFFSGSFSLGEMYDDNILGYSSADLQVLDSGSKPTKFGIRNPGDYRTSLDLRVDLNPDISRRNPTRMRFRLGTDFFARSSVENYQSYGADLKQNFLRSNYFQTGFRYVPSFYLRNLVQVDTATGARGKYLKADFSEQSYFFELGRRFSPHFAISFGYAHEKIDYNSGFDERDSRGNSYYGGLDFGIGRNVGLNIGYSRKDSKAKGADMMLLIEDISSKTDRFDFGLDFNLRKALGIPLSFAPSYTYEYQKYTTFKTLDTYHYGRKDNDYRISSELSYGWGRNFRQYLRYSYERNKTNKQGTLDVGDYKANRVSSGFVWLF